jgi:UDP-glucuronate 4-epimerase
MILTWSIIQFPPANKPFREDDVGIMPVSPYGASKLATEHLGSCWNYVHGSSIHATALRFFTVYGPRGRPDMMMLHLLNSVLTGNEVPYHNGGEMYRDWTYISDIVDGIVRAAQRPDGFQVYNLGRGEPVRLGDVVEMLCKYMGRSPNLRVIPMPKVDIFKTHADISRARTCLGYAPSVSVVEGLKTIVEWFCQEHPEIKNKAS